MKIKNIFLSTLAVAALSSCSDFLNVDHPSDVDPSFVFSNTEDATNLVNGVYVLFAEDPYTSRMSNAWMQNTDVEIMCPNAGMPSGGHRSDLWGLQASEDVSFADVYRAWNNNLEAIELANQVIEGATNSAIAENSEIKQIKGEGVCLKAYRYLMLCNFWGDVPLYKEACKKFEDGDLPRTDKNYVFSHCLQQLVDVEPDMKWSDVNTGGIERMNRDFCIGLIAKIALFRAGYGMTADGEMKKADDYLDTANDEGLAVTYKNNSGQQVTARTCAEYYQLAKDYCQKLITLKGRELRPVYATIFEDQVNMTHKNNDEILYEVAFVNNRGGDVGWCIGVTNTGACHNGTTTNQVGISPIYYQSFADNDVRRDATCSRYQHDADTIKVISNVTGMNVTKWDRYNCPVALGGSSSKGTGINWPVMRYAEVLLMLAEAENELNGPTALAKEMLTKVRARAFAGQSTYDQDVTQYVNNLNSKQAFFDAIVNERAWEFGGECIRKWDLQRWNNYGDKINETVAMLNAWGIASNKELMESNPELANSYPVAKVNGWANYLFFQKVLKGKLPSDLVWINNNKELAEEYLEEHNIKADSIKWGSQLLKNVTTYLYQGKEFTACKKETKGDENTYTLGTAPNDVVVTVAKGEETGITRKRVYQSADFTTRLYRGYTGDTGKGTGPVPYLMPIGTTTLSSSAVLNNEGYCFKKTYTGEGVNVTFATVETPYK